MTVETMSDRYRRSKPSAYENAAEWGDFILSVDPSAVMQKTDLGPAIMFTDGSKYLMPRRKAEEKSR